MTFSVICLLIFILDTDSGAVLKMGTKILDPPPFVNTWGPGDVKQLPTLYVLLLHVDVTEF